MSSSNSLVGTSIPRLEDRPFLQGTACYLDDLKLPGVLSVAFIRSPHGHARVRRLSFDRARQVPGFVAAFGPRDLEVFGKPMPPMSLEPGVTEKTPEPLTEEARFCGDRVAVIVADDPYSAADVAAAVEVDYEMLPVVMDARDAMKDGAPLIHADTPGNVVARMHFAKGNADQAFQQADVTVKHHFFTQRAFNASIEPRGVAAQPGGEDGVVVTVWTSTQASSVVARCVSEALGLKPYQVQVITPYVGGGFGSKGRVYPEEVVVAALAQHLGKPCKWEPTRQEDFLSTCQGHGVHTDAELAAKKDGTIIGLRAHVVQDTGAYLLGPLRPPQYGVQHLLGPYHIPSADVQMDAAYTNKTQLTPIRGGGREQGTFVIERLVDHLARELGMDPVEVRRRNLIQPDEMPYDTHYPRPFGGNVVYDSGDYPGELEEAYPLIGYEQVRRAQPAEREAGKYRGVAICTFPESTAMGEEGARVEVRSDGSVKLSLGSPDTGQSHWTTMAQIAAEELGVSPECIQFESGNTRAMGIGSGTYASRFAVMGGNATSQAARQVRERALVVAGSLLGQTPEGMEIEDGVVRVKGKAAHGQTFKLWDLVPEAQDMGIPLDVTYVFAPKTAVTYTSGAFGAVVEVDMETGQIKVEKIVAVHDGGKIINPLVAEGQMQGGVTMGLGEVLGERMVYDEQGKLLSDSFRSYYLPRAGDVPPIITRSHPSYTQNNPESIKGMGETGVIGILPTLVGAIEDALAPFGVRLNELPIQAEELARMCAQQRSKVTAHGGK